MEVAGLAIGVIGLLAQAVRGYKDCTLLLETYRNHYKDLRKLHESLSVQNKVFNRECLLLLGSIVRQELAIEMLDNYSHAGWSNRHLDELWELSLSQHFNTPIRIIGETLCEVDNELSGKNFSDPTRWYQTIRMRVEWILSKKKNLQELLNTLRKQNQDLRWLREQETSLREAQGRTRSRGNGLVCLSSSGFATRNAAKRLYSGLATTAVCTCHCLSLRLQQLEGQSSLVLNQKPEGPSRGPSTTEKICFRFIVTKNVKNEDTILEENECTCLTVDSEFHGMDPGAHSIPKTSVLREMNLIINKGRIQQHGINELHTNDMVLVNTAAPTSSAADFGNKSTEPTSNVVTIEDLCSHLQSLQLGPGLKTNECIGAIQNTATTMDYRHLIYRDPDSYHITYRVSLSRVFTNKDKKVLFSRDLRLKTAFLLSHSLLQFGSSQGYWFQDRWRAQDIFFFLDHQTYPAALDSALIPYIEVLFPKPSKGKGLAITSASSSTAAPTMPAPGLSRNQKLFSLALVLTEIAFGDSIFNHQDPSGLPGGIQNEFVEYIKAKSIIDSNMLVREMGSVYAAVVKRCFYCDFGIGEEDLEKEEVQNVFYERVVLELEHCLKTFRGE